MKYEWKKQDRRLYLPEKDPEIVTVPPMKFLMLDGKGNPNHPDFAKAVGALFSLSYAIKMLPKKGVTPPGYYEYSVFPLEGEWDLLDEVKNSASLDKASLVYTIMVRQPDFVTEDVIQAALESARRKKPDLLLEQIRFATLDEGLCVQMLHIGSYDNEPESFRKMEEYCEVNHLKRAVKTHREIYIRDARKTSPDKLKTVLRFKVINS